MTAGSSRAARPPAGPAGTPTPPRHARRQARSAGTAPTDRRSPPAIPPPAPRASPGPGEDHHIQPRAGTVTTAVAARPVNDHAPGVSSVNTPQRRDPAGPALPVGRRLRSEEHTSELQSPVHLV